MCVFLLPLSSCGFLCRSSTNRAGILKCTNMGEWKKHKIGGRANINWHFQSFGQFTYLPAMENWPYGLCFFPFKEHKPYQGTLGSLEVILIGSRIRPGPSMDPTGTLKWTSWFSRKIQAKIPFVHFTLSSPSKHFGTLFLVILELYQGLGDPPGPSWTPKWTSKWILQNKKIILAWVCLENH